MGEPLHSKITQLMTAIVIGATVVLLLHTTAFSIGLCLLACMYVAVVLMRDYVLKVSLYRKSGLLFLLFQLGLALVIFVLSEDFFAQIYILILIGEFTFYRTRIQSIVFTVASYGCCVLGLWMYRHFPPFDQIYYVIPRAIEYAGIFGISLLAKIAFQQKNQLARDNERLRLASMELERRAKLQERTRIARDIHDSVGHTLTSALTGLQTAAHAIGKNHYSLALEMIERTKDNILRGLDDVRASVHLLRDNVPAHPFIPELIGLIEETKKQTQVEIAYDIDPAMPELSPTIEIAIYRALQEGLTNGIRHGASTVFHFSLTHQAGRIRFVLSDNGQASLPIVYGFGLNAMKERVEDVGGEMAIAADASARGTTLTITIPLQTTMTERSERIV